MAIVLYREGDTHEEHGVKCEIGRFPVARLQAHLDAGWVTDPTQLCEPEPELIALSKDGKTQEFTPEEIPARMAEGWAVPAPKAKKAAAKKK